MHGLTSSVKQLISKKVFLKFDQRTYVQASAAKSSNKLHCYNNLYPWKNGKEFADLLFSSVVFNEGGLIAINKPFGVKIYDHDKPGAPSKPGGRKIVPMVPETDYTIEKALPILKNFFGAPGLTILKSAEKYTSGIVLLGKSGKVSEMLTRSIDIAKRQKTPHLVHWMLTLGVPVVQSGKERIGIKLIGKANQPKHPVLQLEMSKRSIKSHIVRPVNVEYKVIAENKIASSSLVEISSSSVAYHFVRVYASSRIVPILGDILYSSRMNTLLGMPVHLHVQHAQANDMQALPKKMSEALNLPPGVYGHVMMPTMLHYRSIILPSFAGKDVVITAPPPPHFQWTAEQLSLL